MKKIQCPGFDETCPYLNVKDWTCRMLEEEGTHPKDECDDYAYYNEDDNC